ncbi:MULTISPECIES: hypothetical protein [Sphingomonas]|uniref:hypothetical protein n=1 Tax=Sphingomonas TaxID=13687 RepID=UPI00082C8B4E|nr:hypothetical protein [Sphingomonas sp. CCH10-B3]
MSSLIGSTKSFASLSSTLLARKGQARPAMRSQGFSGFGNVSEVIDDLGWNDMGTEVPAQPPVAVVTPPVPPVLRQREALKEEFEAPVSAPADSAPVAESAAAAEPAKPVAAPRAPVGMKAKAAFTLRLDHDRHLRLRLASALANRSAQQIVTTALDDYLNALPDLDALAKQAASRGDTEMDMGD